MRLMLRRSVGNLAGMDLIFIILVAEAAAHSMGNYKSVSDGLDVPYIERLVSNQPVQVIKDGQLLRNNMRREFLTKEELIEHLRQEGIEEIKDVKEAYIEEHGKLTAISKKDSK